MTLNNMVEVIRELHPSVGRTQIIFDINHALVEFARLTRLLYAKTQLYDTTDKVSEDQSLFLTRWRMPIEVYEVLLVDQVYKEDFFLEDNILVVKWVNHYVKDLNIEYIRYPMAIHLDADTPEIPDEFHYAIVARVLERYFARDAKNMQVALYWGTIYREKVVEAKRYSNTRSRRNENPSIGGVKVITDFQTGLSLNQGLNTIPMRRTFTSKDSYAITLNGNGVSVVETSDTTDPHGNRTTTTFDVYAADPIVGAFDYIVTGT
jgi:hypothetical protein